MKDVEFVQEIDGYRIIQGFSFLSADPVETAKAVKEAIIKNPDLAEIDRETLYKNFAVYTTNDPGPGGKFITKEERAEHEALFVALQQHQLLTDALEIIPDFRDVEYWLSEGSRWAKTKIKNIGVEVPEGAVLPDALTADQQAEIAVQNEADRIAALEPEAKAAEKQDRLDAAADEADRLSRRAQIQAKAFDAAAWYGEQAEGIEAKYA
jgi:hypothetical protein